MKTSEPTNDGHNGSTTPNSQHKQTSKRQRLVVQPPLAIPLDGEHEQAAIDALAELLATWRERHYGESNTD